MSSETAILWVRDGDEELLERVSPKELASDLFCMRSGIQDLMRNFAVTNQQDDEFYYLETVVEPFIRVHVEVRPTAGNGADYLMSIMQGGRCVSGRYSVHGIYKIHY